MTRIYDNAFSDDLAAFQTIALNGRYPLALTLAYLPQSNGSIPEKKSYFQVYNTTFEQYFFSLSVERTLPFSYGSLPTTVFVFCTFYMIFRSSSDISRRPASLYSLQPSLVMKIGFVPWHLRSLLK